MNTIVKATGISSDSCITSSVQHAKTAAHCCIEAAGIDIQDINFMFNVGIYRDQNIVEPSMAALIQKEIGINPDFIRFPVSSPAFSTDLMNGALGAINAFHMADSLFKAGREGYVLIVSSDVHPSMAPADGFDINPFGAAVLLAPSDNTSGFVDFTFSNTNDDYVGEESYIDFSQHGTDARNKMMVDTSQDYYERLLAFTTETAQSFIAKHSLDMRRTLLIGPSLTADFASQLGKNLETPESSIVNVAKDHGNVFTSSFSVGLHKLKNEKLDTDHSNILFVGGSAGLNAGCALYKL